MSKCVQKYSRQIGGRNQNCKAQLTRLKMCNIHFYQFLNFENSEYYKPTVKIYFINNNYVNIYNYVYMMFYVI